MKIKTNRKHQENNDFVDTDSIIELAKEYGVDTSNVPNVTVTQYLKRVGRNDLSRVYEFVTKDLKNT
jgi:hypothetical protein